LDTAPLEIINLCRTNQSFAKICRDNYFWQLKYQQDINLPLPQGYDFKSIYFDYFANQLKYLTVEIGNEVRRLWIPGHLTLDFLIFELINRERITSVYKNIQLLINFINKIGDITDTLTYPPKKSKASYLFHQSLMKLPSWKDLSSIKITIQLLPSKSFKMEFD